VIGFGFQFFGWHHAALAQAIPAFSVGGGHHGRHCGGHDDGAARHGLCAGGGAAAGSGHLRQHSAADSVCAVRQQHDAVGGANGDCVADDGRRPGAAGRPRLNTLYRAGRTTGLHQRRDFAAVRRAAAGLYGQFPVAPGDQRFQQWRLDPDYLGPGHAAHGRHLAALAPAQPAAWPLQPAAAVAGQTLPGAPAAGVRPEQDGRRCRRAPGADDAGYFRYRAGHLGRHGPHGRAGYRPCAERPAGAEPGARCCRRRC